MDDKYWNDVVGFINSHIRHGENIVAPIEFKECFDENIIIDYSSTYYMKKEMAWAAIHKGKIREIDIVLLKYIQKYFIPVYANEVFIVFSNHKELSKIDNSSHHLRSYMEKIGQLDKDDNDRFLNTCSNFDIRMKYDEMTRGTALRIHDILSKPRTEMEQICRYSCQTTYLGDETILCRILAKYKLYVDARDIGITPHLCLDGYWEPWITLALARIIQPGWNCVDIGANCGYYTLIMADIVGHSGHVTAIEPNPRLAVMLNKTLEINGFQQWTKVLQKAVSDMSTGHVVLVIPRDRLLNATICKYKNITSTDDKIENVSTITLDAITKDWQHVDLVKIDAEGAEEAIWHGMSGTMRKNKDLTIVMEFNCSRYSDPRTFLQNIQKEGFLLRYIDFDSNIKSLTIEQCLTEHPDDDWMLFLKR